MRSVNKVVLIGHVASDPEQNTTKTGKTLCYFPLATNRDWVDSSGEKHESTDYHRIVAWQKLGDICTDYVTKGKALYVDGRLTNRSYKNKEGEMKYYTEIVADTVNFLSVKNKSNEINVEEVSKNK